MVTQPLHQRGNGVSKELMATEMIPASPVYAEEASQIVNIRPLDLCLLRDLLRMQLDSAEGFQLDELTSRSACHMVCVQVACSLWRFLTICMVWCRMHCQAGSDDIDEDCCACLENPKDIVFTPF